MIITTSLHEPHTYFIFKDNGQECKLRFKNNKLTVVGGYMSPKKKEIAIKKIKEIN